VLVTGVVGDQHFRHALKFGGRLRSSADIFTRNEDIDGLTEFERRGESPCSRVVQSPARDFR